MTRDLEFVAPALATILALVALFALFLYANYIPEPESLNPPTLISIIPEKSGSSIHIHGSGYPIAYTVIYLNGLEYKQVRNNRDGSFTLDVSFGDDGEQKVQLSQKFNEIKSDLTEEYATISDITPPDIKKYIRYTWLPESTIKSVYTLSGQGPENTDISFGGQGATKTNQYGAFSIPINFGQGANNVPVVMSDEFGNSATAENIKIYVDSVGPQIDIPYCISQASEYVCLSTSQWQSSNLPGSVPIPIRGIIRGDVQKVTINGLNLPIRDGSYIDTEVWLWVNFGSNNFKVIATDKMGNKSESNFPIEVERLQKTILQNNLQYYDFSDSGFDAGFEWAEENGISSYYECSGASTSFNDGCYAWIEGLHQQMIDDGIVEEDYFR
jgi:hypothetical protein